MITPINSTKENHPKMSELSLPQKPRNLSRHQYGTLKFIANNHVTLTYLRHAHGNTLGSCAYNGWIAKTGKGLGDDAEIVLTHAGKEALRTYTEATMNERSHEGDLTERCLRLLTHSRAKNVVSLQRSA